MVKTKREESAIENDMKFFVGIIVGGFSIILILTMLSYMPDAETASNIGFVIIIILITLAIAWFLKDPILWSK